MGGGSGGVGWEGLVGGGGGQGGCERRIEVFVKIQKNKQIQRIYVPCQDFFLRNKESSEKVKFIRGVTLTRYILFTYVDSNNA